MDAKPAYTMLKRRLRRKLALMGKKQPFKKQPFIIGSLVKIQRLCGNPNCRCVRESHKHPAHLLTTKVNGKTRAIYVPVDMVEEVRQWCRQYCQIKADIKEVSECCEQLIRLHTKEKRTRIGKQRMSNDI